MILIHRKSGKIFYLNDTNKDFNTNFGIIKKEDIQNAKNGDILRTHIGEEFVVIEDNFNDLIRKNFKKITQTLHPKDFALLNSLVFIEKNWRIVEGGTGSGFLTILLAKSVPEGFVYSYEIRDDFYKIAKENIERFNIKNVEIKLKDINKGIDEKNIDLIILDIPDPWNTLEHSYNSLKIGGYLAVFLPNMTSVIKLLNKNEKFHLIGIYENIVRKWKYRKDDVLRPENMQLVHTEFLVLFRRI